MTDKQAVTERADPTRPNAHLYDFTCPHCPFTSTGWAKKGWATDRGEQHYAEHRGEAVTEELHDFHVARGLATPIDQD